MKRANRTAAACLLVLVIGSTSGIGRAQERAVEDRLVAFSQQLRLGMTLATVAVYSPTIDDLRLHAQQLVNLLEGPQGKHFARPAPPGEDVSGLLVEIATLGARFEAPTIDPEIRVRVVDASGNVRAFLSCALEAVLSALGERRIDRASADMLRAYAFLLAAYERPCDLPYVPALWTILRAFGLTDRLGDRSQGQ